MGRSPAGLLVAPAHASRGASPHERGAECGLVRSKAQLLREERATTHQRSKPSVGEKLLQPLGSNIARPGKSWSRNRDPWWLTDSKAAGVVAESTPRGTVLENGQGDLWPLSLPGTCRPEDRRTCSGHCCGQERRDCLWPRGRRAEREENATRERARLRAQQTWRCPRALHPQSRWPRAPRLISWGLRTVNTAIRTSAPQRLKALR